MTTSTFIMEGVFHWRDNEGKETLSIKWGQEKKLYMCRKMITMDLPTGVH